MQKFIGGLMLAVAGCTALPAESEKTPDPAPSGDHCNATQAQALLGRPASSEVAKEAQRLSMAETVRWLQPGQIVTMEYRFGRLNIHLDANSRVERIICG